MGNHGDVTTADFDDSSAHIVTTPLQWACDNVACECEFEQRITLGGPADTGARVDATLHNHRSDTTEYSARRQELPAVYTNGPYYRLFTTEGGELKEVNVPRPLLFFFFLACFGGGGGGDCGVGCGILAPHEPRTAPPHGSPAHLSMHSTMRGGTRPTRSHGSRAPSPRTSTGRPSWTRTGGAWASSTSTPPIS